MCIYYLLFFRSFLFVLLAKKEKKKAVPIGTTFPFLARSTEKDITGFFEKSACDKAFSDFFYIFSCSM